MYLKFIVLGVREAESNYF